MLIAVDETAQRMTVSVDGVPQFYWPVSTGRSGYETPTGNFAPMRMERDHYSKEWDDAPMPYSIFFTDRGHAIHGSTETKRLGSPASRGCVRLEPSNAAKLFALVETAGMANTKVVITGSGLAGWDSPGRHPFGAAPSVVLGPEWDSYYAPPQIIYPEVYSPYNEAYGAPRFYRHRRR